MNFVWDIIGVNELFVGLTKFTPRIKVRYMKRFAFRIKFRFHTEYTSTCIYCPDVDLVQELLLYFRMVFSSLPHEFIEDFVAETPRLTVDVRSGLQRYGAMVLTLDWLVILGTIFIQTWKSEGCLILFILMLIICFSL